MHVCSFLECEWARDESDLTANGVDATAFVITFMLSNCQKEPFASLLVFTVARERRGKKSAYSLWSYNRFPRMRLKCHHNKSIRFRTEYNNNKMSFHWKPNCGNWGWNEVDRRIVICFFFFFAGFGIRHLEAFDEFWDFFGNQFSRLIWKLNETQKCIQEGIGEEESQWTWWLLHIIWCGTHMW